MLIVGGVIIAITSVIVGVAAKKQQTAGTAAASPKAQAQLKELKNALIGMLVVCIVGALVLFGLATWKGIEEIDDNNNKNHISFINTILKVPLKSIF